MLLDDALASRKSDKEGFVRYNLTISMSILRSIVAMARGKGDPSPTPPPSAPAPPATPAPEPYVPVFDPYSGKSPMSEAARKELFTAPAQRPEKPQRWGENFGYLEIPDNAWAGIVRRAAPLFPRALLADLETAAAKIAEIREKETQFYHQAAIKAAKEQRLTREANVTAGDWAAVENFKSRSRDEIIADYAKNLKAMKSTRNSLAKDAMAKTGPIVEAIATVARDEAEKLEAAEKRAAKEYAIPFHPSRTLVSLMQITWRVSEKITPYSYPGDLLKFLKP